LLRHTTVSRGGSKCRYFDHRLASHHDGGSEGWTSERKTVKNENGDKIQDGDQPNDFFKEYTLAVIMFVGLVIRFLFSFDLK
jgi:hypothetical protein